MHVDVDALRVDIKAHIGEGVATFGEKGRISLFDGLFDG